MTINTISVQQFHECVLGIQQVAERLERLGAAFHRVGNDTVNAELHQHAEQLLANIAVVENYADQMLRQWLDATKETSGYLLKAALAGAFTEPTHDEPPDTTAGR